jgi:hypothetical protein
MLLLKSSQLESSIERMLFSDVAVEVISSEHTLAR